MMGSVAYALCAITSGVCFALLLRAYLKNRTRLLLWCSIGFFLFALQNIVLFLDLVIIQQISLAIWRTSIGFLAAAVMSLGLIWEQR